MTLALCALLLSAITAGCGGGGSSSSAGGASTGGGENEASGTITKGGTLNISLGPEVGNLSAIQALDGTDLSVASQINEPLFKENTEGKVVPWLVEKSEAAKRDTEFTFHLRKGVEFSDGKPMTSADVLWTLETDRHAPEWEGLLETIKSVKAPAEDEVVVTTSQPFPELTVILSQWSFAVMPKDYGGVSAQQFNKEPIGTGPFMFTAHKSGESLTLEKNPHYWQSGKPYLQKVVFHTVDNANSRAQQLQAGALDAVLGPPWALVESIENNPETEFADFPEGYGKIIYVNAKSPFGSNRNAREALNLAIDREALVESVLVGHGQPAGNLIPPPIPGSDPSVKAPEYNPEKAKELVAKAVKEGFKPELTLTMGVGDEFWGVAGQALQQELEEVGIKTKIQPLDESTFVDKLFEGEYEAGLGYFTSAVPTPAEAFGFYLAVNSYFTQAPPQKIAKLLSEATVEPNDQKRKEIYNDMQHLVAEEQYLQPTVYSPFPWGLSSKVKGLHVGAIGIPWLIETYIEE
ncbi:MAG: ABC transporter substrate-binding protein [Solirubrobacterales bacterium]